MPLLVNDCPDEQVDVLLDCVARAGPLLGARICVEVQHTGEADRAGERECQLVDPTDETTYVFVNHVRLPTTPIRFMLQFAKPSFRKYVAANLHANEIGNAPVICRTV